MGKEAGDLLFPPHPDRPEPNSKYEARKLKLK